MQYPQFQLGFGKVETQLSFLFGVQTKLCHVKSHMTFLVTSASVALPDRLTLFHTEPTKNPRCRLVELFVNYSST